MAVNINSVYQKVLALSNKEQRGYITPQEFNLLADMAQNDIYENYFHQARNSNAKIKDDDQYTDTLEMIEAKLSPFYKESTITTVSSNVMTLPTDLYKIVSVRLGPPAPSSSTTENYATEINRKEEGMLRFAGNSSALYPLSSSTVYCRISGTQIRFTPDVTNSMPISVSYYKEPTTPSFGYVVVNEKALYNSNTSVDFELASSEEEHLVSRILLLAGGAIKQPDLSQGAASLLQQRNQEQNS
tara:strand:- start:723 stop:1451 length:729 start_codon:yes stop_codon:yes gene_type:complete